VLLYFTSVSFVHGDMYCGQRNCYDVLGVNSGNTGAEMKKAYRKLSMMYHPDRNSDPTASDMFMDITTAYETLSNDEKRDAYDYYLLHPEDNMYNQYAYYKAKYQTKTDVRLVLIGVLGVLCFVNYRVLMDNHNRNIRLLPEYKAKVVELNRKKDISNSKGATTDMHTLIATQLHDVLKPPNLSDIFLVKFVYFLIRSPIYIVEFRNNYILRAAMDAENEKLSIKKEQESQLRNDEISKSKQRKREEKQAREESKRRMAEEKLREEKRGIEKAASFELARAESAKILYNRLQQLSPDISKSVYHDLLVIATSPFFELGILQSMLARLRIPADVETSLRQINQLTQENLERRDQELRNLSSDMPSASSPWTSKETACLIKSLGKFPGGSRNRWLNISNYITSSCQSSKSPDECASKASIMKTMKVSSNPAWTTAEQRLLEEGIKKYSTVEDTKEKWRSISKLVPDRSAKECAIRFKEIRTRILEEKKNVLTRNEATQR